MYVPRQFEEKRVEVLHGLIRAYPLATLITHSPDGLHANHVPLQLSESPAPHGTLRGHIARANPLMRQLTGSFETLAIFHGPQAYVTPSLYATKKETGKVVPTWNYSVVYAYGSLRVVDNAAWLRAQLEALTDQNEASFDDPWAVSDAPEDHIKKVMAAIVGIEMVINRLLGKWKVSQNQPKRNQTGVISGLKASGLPESEAMAALVEARVDSAD